MDSAMAMFLAQGYQDTTVDQIAVAAGVSKTTVYKNFADKERLFTDVILNTIEPTGIDLIDRIASLANTDDAPHDLSVLSRSLLSNLMQPALLQRRRVVISEANRLPDFGRTYYRLTYERTLEALASTFEELTRRGLLHTKEPRLAAEHFVWLAIGPARNEVMLCGDSTQFAAPELDHYADTAVTVFLAAYGDGETR